MRRIFGFTNPIVSRCDAQSSSIKFKAMLCAKAPKAQRRKHIQTKHIVHIVIVHIVTISSNNELLGTSASLLVTSAFLVVTRS